MANNERVTNMAYVNSTRVESGLVDRLAALVAAYREARAKRLVYRQTLNELSALSGRELADLGLDRSNIRSVAYEAAYGETK